MDEKVFFNFLTQLFYFFGVVFLIGFLISLINRYFYRLVRYNRAVCLGTGLLGTPIHELSHAAMCVVFGHKITKMRLFQPDDENGVLGFVEHSYNPKKLWHVIGNYFIGVAPIVCGSAFILLLTSWLLPHSFDDMIDSIEAFARFKGDVFSSEWFEAFGEVFFGVILAIVTASFAEWEIWVFLIFAMCIALHMNLSGADIKNALPSIPVLAIILFVANLVLSLISGALYRDYLEAIALVGVFLSGTMLLSVVLSLAYLLVGFLIKTALNLIFRRRLF